VKPDYTDGEFVALERRLRVRPWAIFWWIVFTTGFAGAAFQVSNNGEVVVYVVGAACAPPLANFTAWAASALQRRVSVEEAAQLTGHLLSREATIWRSAPGRRGVRPQ
jgi:hypothetical protein